MSTKELRGISRRPSTTQAPSSEPATPEQVVARANRSAGKPYPRRVALDLNDEQLRALRLAGVEDGIPITTRARALVTLWRESADLQREAARVAAADMVRTRQGGK